MDDEVTTAGSPPWLSLPGWVLLGSMVVTVIAWVDVVDPDFGRWNSAQTFASLLMLGAAGRLVERSDPSTLRHRRWMLRGCELWLAADVFALVLAGTGADTVWSPLLELLYLGAQTSWMISVVLVATRVLAGSSARRLADGALIGTTIGFAIFTIAAGGASSLDRTGYGVATLVVDGVLIASSLIISVHDGVGGSSKAYLVVTASWVLLLLTDATFVYSGVLDDMLSDWVLNLGWTTSSLVRAVGYWLVATTSPSVPSAAAEASHRRVLLPACLTGIAVVVAVRPPSEWTGISRALIVVVLATIIVREVLIGAEQQRLADQARAVNAELAFRAERDELTGVANRTCLLAALNTRSNAAGRHTIAFVDLDDFKSVNDRHGHLAGDDVLRVVAARLVEAAGDGGLVARFGGDEFVVLRAPWTGRSRRPDPQQHRPPDPPQR